MAASPLRRICINILCIACFYPLHAFSGFSITAGASTGVYLLPADVNGFIDGSASTYNRYVWPEATRNDYGYLEQSYKYKHPFPARTLPSAGFNFGLSYTGSGRLGFFIDGSRTFSLLDKEISQSAPQTLPQDQYSMIPHDYRLLQCTSSDQLYLKSFQLGIGISYAVPIGKTTRIIAAGSLGTVNYEQHFRIETTSIITGYYQNNGNLVYSDTTGKGTFEAFGIRYEAACFKPAITFEKDLRQAPVSAWIGLSCPIALIEKGRYFTESSSSDYYSATYYPSSRFWTGQVQLSAGVRYFFGTGDKQ